jgi:cytidylate kinase
MTAAIPVITIDGPSGTGKGTLAAAVAERLGYHLLDSGALYRAVALVALETGADLDDPALLEGIARGLDIRFARAPGPPGPPLTLLAGRDVTATLRGEACGEAASKVAAVPAVRRALLARQHAFRAPPGLVADGRDMGTVVFPDAGLKVYLTASAEARAARRHKQLKEQGSDVSLAGLAAAIAERDRRDSTRAVAPLRPAGDAVTIDSTGLDARGVFERTMQLVEAYRARVTT